MVKRSFWILVVAAALLAIMSTAAWAQGGDDPSAQAQNDLATDALWVTLAPLMAIATMIERALEVFWERWETIGVWPNRGGAVTNYPPYIMWKRTRSHLLGTAMAIVAVGLTNVRLFRLLGFDVLFSSPGMTLFNAGVGGILDNFTLGTLIDWLLTAGVIGWGGTELTHNVIEGLVKGRNLWKEMREVGAGERAIADAQFFNDYVAPQLEKHGVSAAMLRQTFEAMEAVGIHPDRLIHSMTVGKVDDFVNSLAAKPEQAAAAQAIRAFLDGVPEEKKAEIPNVSTVLSLLTPAQRLRFLGG